MLHRSSVGLRKRKPHGKSYGEAGADTAVPESVSFHPFIICSLGEELGKKFETLKKISVTLVVLEATSQIR